MRFIVKSNIAKNHKAKVNLEMYINKDLVNFDFQYQQNCQ